MSQILHFLQMRTNITQLKTNVELQNGQFKALHLALTNSKVKDAGGGDFGG